MVQSMSVSERYPSCEKGLFISTTSWFHGEAKLTRGLVGMRGQFSVVSDGTLTEL